MVGRIGTGDTARSDCPVHPVSPSGANGPVSPSESVAGRRIDRNDDVTPAGTGRSSSGAAGRPAGSWDLSIDADGLVDAIEDMILELGTSRLAAVAIAAARVREDGVLVDHEHHPLGRALAASAFLGPVLEEEPATSESVTSAG